MHLTRRVQQDNPEGNVSKETTRQQMLLDEMSQTQTTAVAQLHDKKGKGKAAKMKLRSKFQTKIAHNKPEMPKPGSLMGILGSTNNYIIRDQPPPGSHSSLETDGPTR